VQIALALAFVMAGSAKLSGEPVMLAMFEKLGLGQWFCYLTGGIEVASAILLLIPKFVAFGALLLCATMIGAVITHLLVIGGNATVPAVQLVLSAFVAWKRIPARRA
jgi:uncharacterized membrane protein YphA (DoxX/SURF4 family)